MRLTSAAIVGALAFGCALYADTADARTKLSGTWQATGATEKWVIDEKPDAIHISHVANSDKPVEIVCNTVGKECELKHDGKKGTVSMYYNGPKLVQLETHGSEVVKRRFTVSPDGNTLEVEVMPIVPAGKTETFKFTRMQEQTASK